MFHCFRLCLLVLLVALLTSCVSAGTPSSGNGVSPTALPSSREPQLAPPVPGSYAALGASETYGIGAVPHTRGYAYHLARLLHARHFVDVGIPGTTISAAYQTELTTALSTRPSLCTVFFGINDIRGGVTRGEFLQTLHDLVATLRRARATVLVVGFPDLSLVPAVRRAHIGGLARITASWNAGMRRVARQTGAHFFDLTAFGTEIARNPGYIAADGLHPSTAGHRRLAQLLAGAISREGLWKSR